MDRGAWKVTVHGVTESQTGLSNYNHYYCCYYYYYPISITRLPCVIFFFFLYFPGGSDGKESACNAGDSGSVPRLGRSPGEANGNPAQYSCLENSMDRGLWCVEVHGVAKSQTQLCNFRFTHENFNKQICYKTVSPTNKNKQKKKRKNYLWQRGKYKHIIIKKQTHSRGIVKRQVFSECTIYYEDKQKSFGRK